MLTILDEKNKGYALGAADYMVKPIDRDRLRALFAGTAAAPAARRALVVEDDPDTRAWLCRAARARKAGPWPRPRTAAWRWRASPKRRRIWCCWT